MIQTGKSAIRALRQHVPLLLSLALGAAAMSSHPVLAQMRFPSNPTSMSQCEAANEHATALYMEQSRLQDIYSKQYGQLNNQLTNDCRGSRDFSRCAEPYRRKLHELHEISSKHYSEYVRLKGEAVRQNNACRSIAHAHEQQAAQQRHAAEEQRRMQERRADEQRRNAEQLERRAQEERNRQVYEENQKRAYAAQLETQRREYERQQARQPHVIAQGQPSPYNPATRNDPRQVMTPEMAAAKAQADRAAAQKQREDEAQALRDVAGNLRDSVRGNPPSSAPARLAGTTAQASESNALINAGRGGSPVAGAIGSSGITTAGAQGADALVSLGQALPATQGASTPSRSGPATAPSPSAPSTARPSTTQPVSPTATASRPASPEQAAAPAQWNQATAPDTARPGAPAPGTQPVAPAVTAAKPASPQEACGKRIFLALSRCITSQCEKPEFKGHAQCKPVETVQSRD